MYMYEYNKTKMHTWCSTKMIVDYLIFLFSFKTDHGHVSSPADSIRLSPGEILIETMLVYEKATFWMGSDIYTLDSG